MSVQLQGVQKSVAGETHIYPTDLEITSGLNVIIGHTLAGKTSLLRIIAGLDQPSAGKVLHKGLDVTHVPLQERKVAMVYQQFINYPSFTVYDNIASALRLAKLNKNEIDRKVRETAELLRIEALLERYPSELSGGQQQRTAIARALVKEADILLFDEPLVNLDYKLREELRQEMSALFTDRDTIAIYATTEPSEALLLGGTTVVIDQGRVLQSGSSLSVYRQPSTRRVAEVFSDPKINIIEGRLAQGRVEIDDVPSFPLPADSQNLDDGNYLFGIRAGHLSVQDESDPQDSAPVCIPGKIEFAEVSGSETYVYFRYGDLRWVVHQAGVHAYHLDQAISVSLNPERLFVFDVDGELRHAPVRTNYY